MAKKFERTVDCAVEHPLYNGDRFELEQRIIKAWTIIDDLKNAENMDHVYTIASYYDIQFNQLWDLFEEMIHSGQFKDKK